MKKAKNTPTQPKTPRERLAAKSEKQSNGCVLWTGATATNGYGIISVHGKDRLVHRYAWELANNKPVPADMVVMHTCDTRNCVAPNHLVSGTQADNMKDKINKGRQGCSTGKHGKKLSLDELKHIYSLVDNGKTGYEVAKLTGRSEQHIYQLIRTREARMRRESIRAQQTALGTLKDIQRAVSTAMNQLLMNPILAK